MKKLNNVLLLLLLLALFPALPAAAAEDPEAMDWDAMTEAFLGERGISGSIIALGYKNLVSGETHYYNADQYMTAASVYKLPLNMYYAEQIYLGEMDWDTRIGGIPYANIMESSIVSSNNELSEMLQDHIGSYIDYRTAIAGIMDVDVTTDTVFLTGNRFTPRQVIAALTKLYDDPERYPGVAERMERAVPTDGFLCYYQPEGLKIIHKYGFLPPEDGSIVNDCGIIYTEEPFALVILTRGCGSSPLMSNYRDLMIEYTDYRTRQRPIEEAEAAALAALPHIEITETGLKTVAVPETPVQPAVPAKAPAAAAEAAEPVLKENLYAVPAVFAAAVLLIAAVFFALRIRSKRAILPCGVLALCAAALALVFCLRTEEAVPVQVIPATVQKTEAVKTEPEPETEATVLRVKLISTATEEDVASLNDYPDLISVDASECTCAAALRRFADAHPDCEVNWSVEVGGLIFENTAEELDLTDLHSADPEAVENAISGLPALRRAVLLRSGLTGPEQEALVRAHPDLEFVWEVPCGRWSVRSDAVCFSTGNSYTSLRGSSDDFALLFEFCTELRALDLTSNNLTDLSGISNLKKLQVLLIGDNPNLTDISPLAALTDLEYLECYSNEQIADFSCLRSLSNIRDINLSYCRKLADLEFLSAMPEAERVWVRGCGIPSADWDPAIRDHPGIKFIFYCASPYAFCADWCATERNVAIRTAFLNWNDVSAWNRWNDITYQTGTPQKAAAPVTYYD